MANNIIQFLFTAKDEASAKIKSLSNTIRSEGKNGMNELSKSSEAATRATSKLSAIIKAVLTGNIIEASRNIAEMGGRMASVAASGAVATAAIMAWGKAIKAAISYRFESSLFNIQTAIEAMNGKAERSTVIFSRQEASLKRVTDSMTAYRNAQAEITEIKKTIGEKSLEGVRTRALIGENDPIRIAKINAAADTELAKIKIQNERDVLAEKQKQHADERTAIERENKLLEEQSKARSLLAGQAAAKANEIAGKIDNTITLGGRVNEEQDTRLIAEQEKALSLQKQLLAENESAAKKRLENQSKLDQMKFAQQVFAEKLNLINELDATERALADKRSADISEMERKKIENASNARKAAAKKIEVGTIDKQINQVMEDLEEVERGFGLAARERVLAEAKGLEEKGKQKFGVGDLNKRLADNEDAKTKSRDQKSFERRLAFARQMESRPGSGFANLPKNMQEILKMDNERKAAANKARQKVEQADKMRQDEVNRQENDKKKLAELQALRDKTQGEIKKLLEKNLQFQGN